MEIQRIKPTQQDRQALTNFMQELCPEEIDFNWLMPVVEKIENLGYYVNLQTMRSDKDGKYFCNITESNHSAIGHCFSNIKIESVYKAVIQFIHWYQKQKSS